MYGSEAVLPTDLEYGAPRVQAYDDNGNLTSLEDAVDQLDEARDIALLYSAKYQQSLRRYHDRHIKGRAFSVGELVLRRVQTTKDRHKLSAPWGGPFTVAQVLRPRMYKIKDAVDDHYRPFYTVNKYPKGGKLVIFTHIYLCY